MPPPRRTGGSPSAVQSRAASFHRLVYTVVLAKKGRLFLRDAEEIRRSRARIMAVAIPSGWALGAALMVVAVLFGGLSKVTLLAVLGGAMLGFWPGLLAN